MAQSRSSYRAFAQRSQADLPLLAGAVLLPYFLLACSHTGSGGTLAAGGAGAGPGLAADGLESGTGGSTGISIQGATAGLGGASAAAGGADLGNNPGAETGAHAGGSGEVGTISAPPIDFTIWSLQLPIGSGTS
ncbi:MAG: hypothetical protein ABSB49_18990, partial [Polyangia bacterium]